MRSKPLAFTLLTAALITGVACGGGTPGADPTVSPSASSLEPTPPPSATTGPSTPVEDLPASFLRCTNTIQAYSIGYPGDWHTAALTADATCNQFHPDPFTIPVAGEFPLTALNSRLTDVSFDQYIAGFTDPIHQTVVSNTATTVLGLPARRIEITSLGMGLDEVGTRRYAYIINRGGVAFAVWTGARAEETRYNSWKSTLDVAVDTLRFL